MKWIVFTLLFMAFYSLLVRDEERCQARVDQVTEQLKAELVEAFEGIDRYTDR